GVGQRGALELALKAALLTELELRRLPTALLQPLLEPGPHLAHRLLSQRVLGRGDHAAHHVAAHRAPDTSRNVAAVARLVPALEGLGLGIAALRDLVSHLVLELLKSLPCSGDHGNVALLPKGHSFHLL